MGLLCHLLLGLLCTIYARVFLNIWHTDGTQHLSSERNMQGLGRCTLHFVFPLLCRSAHVQNGTHWLPHWPIWHIFELFTNLIFSLYSFMDMLKQINVSWIKQINDSVSWPVVVACKFRSSKRKQSVCFRDKSMPFREYIK